eukprot:TRINITY_DN3352_c0_g1_i1.p1 TRINITY_DN3352_c0_g1~~TRINITY_DN3352_c0_g1_i1.p1  ORF type:complete len:170 (+),score=37.81 TRINITY_DN3352_c0_g1_i1:45-512(+)
MDAVLDVQAEVSKWAADISGDAEHDWKAKYSINIQVIDEQHRRIFHLIAKLRDALLVGSSRDLLGTIITELTDYCYQHFAFEEEYIARHGYPETDNHKESHDLFFEKVLYKSAEWEQGLLIRTEELTQFLYDWLVKHILVQDKAYAEYLNEHGVF